MNENELIQQIADAVNRELTIDKLTLKRAECLIHEIEKKAIAMNVAVVIAVSNESGQPIAIHCMDGAYPGSFDVALHKTYTSIAFRMSTEKLGTLSQPGQELYGIQYTNQGKIVIFGGGVPLYYKNKIIGALGVSGGTAKQDTELANYGSVVLQEAMKCL